MRMRLIEIMVCGVCVVACAASEPGEADEDASGRARDTGRVDERVDAGSETDTSPDSASTDAARGDASDDASDDDAGSVDGGALPDALGDTGAERDTSATCGDGTLDEGEGCDDGNTDAGDGCDASCVRELDFLCSPCTRNETCGDDGDLCVDGGCGADCSVWPCEVGQRCVEVELGRETRLQCVPDEGCGLNSEEETCDNGVDDDGDRFVDCADPDCATFAGCGGDELCDDGVDNDGDGNADCADQDCAFEPVCAGLEDCDNGRDDDGDSAVDCADADCAGDPACASGGDPCAEARSASLGTQSGRLSGVSLANGTCGGTGPEQVWLFRARSATTHCIEVDGEPGMDVLVHTRTECTSSATEDGCDDDSGDGLDAQLEQRLLADETISIFVDSVGAGESGDYTLSISEGLCGEGGGGTGGTPLTCFTSAENLGLAGSGSVDGTCPSGCTIGIFVYGTDVYSGDSNVCQAAVHAGVIPASGGDVRVVGLPGQEEYVGSTQNGITSAAWSLGYETSFRVEAR